MIWNKPNRIGLENRSKLLKIKFDQSIVDYSLFTHNENGEITHLLVYIDDIIITGSNNRIIAAETGWNLFINHKSECNICNYKIKSCKSHMEATLKVLKYLKRTPERGLLYKHENEINIIRHCDADWTACPKTRKSITGYCISLGSSFISWKSKKQPIFYQKQNIDR